MIQIPEKFHFEPTANTLTKWLSTRKAKFSAGSFPMPGFFGDDSSDKDTLWFWIAMLLEITGGLITIYFGGSKGTGILIIALLAVIGFIVLDLFFAIKLHDSKPYKIFIDSKLVGNNLTHHDRAALELRRKDVSKNDIWFKIAIIAIVSLKFIAILLLGTLEPIALFFILSFYCLVAYAHLNHTGYYFAHNKTNSMVNKDFKNYSLDKTNISQNRYGNFSTTKSLTNIPITLGGSPIKIEAAENKQQNHYTLYTNGVLLDSEIKLLIVGQTDENKVAIAVAARKLQLEMANDLSTVKIN